MPPGASREARRRARESKTDARDLRRQRREAREAVHDDRSSMQPGGSFELTHRQASPGRGDAPGDARRREATRIDAQPPSAPAATAAAPQALASESPAAAKIARTGVILASSPTSSWSPSPGFMARAMGPRINPSPSPHPPPHPSPLAALANAEQPTANIEKTHAEMHAPSAGSSPTASPGFWERLAEQNKVHIALERRYGGCGVAHNETACFR